MKRLKRRALSTSSYTILLKRMGPMTMREVTAVLNLAIFYGYGGR